VARGIAGVVAGLVAWLVVATLANLLVRVAWPAYAEVEKAMTFSVAMMAVRLVVGAVSSLSAGLAVAWVTRGNGIAAKALVVALIAVFIPVHYALWEKFPFWYHAIFFASLLLITLVGATLIVRDTKGQRVRP